VLSYGPDLLKDPVQKSFRDLKLWSPLGQYAAEADIAASIASKRLHILFDIQLQLAANKQDALARRPAPLIVSFGGQPYTMAAPFVDAFVVDPGIAASETAAFEFSETLIYLPSHYVGRYYPDATGTLIDKARIQRYNDERRVVAAAQCKDNGTQKAEAESPMEVSAAATEETPRRLMFINTNKGEKLDPKSYGMWMQILAHVPSADLHLISYTSADSAKDKEASDEYINNLRQEAAARGIHPCRIIFLPHATQVKHLLRLVPADLFLDSLVYGAHSTAMDAMRAGVPLLTLNGDILARKVAARLQYLSMPEKENSEDTTFRRGNVLVGFSVMEVVEIALRVTRSTDTIDAMLLRSVRRRLAEPLIKPATTAGGSVLPPFYDRSQFQEQLDAGIRSAIELSSSPNESS
jgi:predicted O-linked N-acetylglucosamine transferase (SPINDLY family)